MESENVLKLINLGEANGDPHMPNGPTDTAPLARDRLTGPESGKGANIFILKAKTIVFFVQESIFRNMILFNSKFV